MLLSAYRQGHRGHCLIFFFSVTKHRLNPPLLLINISSSEFILASFPQFSVKERIIFVPTSSPICSPVTRCTSLPFLHHVPLNAACLDTNIEKAAHPSQILFTYQPNHTAPYSKTTQSPP